MPKITIQIEAGCPSGSTKGNWNKTIDVSVHESLARDFVENLMEYARQEAQADHWQVQERDYTVQVTYETTVTGNIDEIENAIWVGSHEIGKLENGEEIRADAIGMNIQEA